MTEIFTLLEISNGVETVNLRSGGNGICLTEGGWKPKIAQPKGGGVFQDSPIAEGRRVVSRHYGDVIETFKLVSSGTEDGVKDDLRKLRTLLESAVNYWIPGNSGDAFAWIKVQSPGDVAARYALIYDYTTPEDDFHFESPYWGTNKTGNSAMQFDLFVERGHWGHVEPGTGECQPISSEQEWDYREGWTARGNVSAAGSGTDAADRGMSQSPTTNTIAHALKLAAGGPMRSVNSGVAWAAPAVHPANNTHSVLALANGNFVTGVTNGANGEIWTSVNDGVNYAIQDGAAPNAMSAPRSFCQHPISGDVYGLYVPNAAAGTLMKSTDNGATWAVSYTPIIQSSNNGRDSIVTSEGLIVFAGQNVIFVSGDNGTSWSEITHETFTPKDVATDVISAIYEHSNGYIFMANGDEVLRSTIQNPQTVADLIDWEIVVVIDNVEEFTLGPEGEIFVATASATRSIFVSKDDGITWGIDFGFGGGQQAIAILTLNNNEILATSENLALGNISYFSAYPTGFPIDAGRDATCNNEVFLANKQNEAQLTHIKIDDAAAFSDIYPMGAGLPAALFPAVPAVGDITYWGIISAIAGNRDGPFNSLIFDIDPIIIIGAVGTNFRVDWEYWNGAWVALTVKDETSFGYNSGANFDSFERAGVSGVYWEPPSDWVATAIDGVTALYVRAVVAAYGGAAVGTPTQQNREVYTVNRAFAEIATDSVSGDLPATNKIDFFNRGDRDGFGGNPPNTFDNRVLMGLRDVARGDEFSAFINIADEQIPAGITPSLGTGASWIADVESHTGRAGRYTANAGHTTFADRFTFTFDGNLAPQYHGEYRAILIGEQDTGAAGTVNNRLKIQSGAGGVQSFSKAVPFAGTSNFEALDMGKFKLPVSDLISGSEPTSSTVITLQTLTVSAVGNPLTDYYSLFLLPVDEWAIDSLDRFNDSGGLSVIGDRQYLRVDSVLFPKVDIRSLGIDDNTLNDAVFAIYEPIANGKAILQTENRQRMWCLALQTSAAGTSFQWLANPWHVHSMQMTKVERYFSMS